MTQATPILVAAKPDQRPLIENLIQLYLYDMTGFIPFPVGTDGRFEYGFLDRFWRHPYLVMVGDEVAGFALVVDECPLTGRRPCWFMAEFFVLKAYRRRGIARQVLSAALSAHSGVWHIAVPQANTLAMAFWSSVLASHGPSVRDLTFEGDDWRLHDFST